MPATKFTARLYALAAGFAAAALIPHHVSAAVSDIVFSDVTTKAFSVVWVSSEAVGDASVEVFTDPGGDNPAPGLTIELVSAATELCDPATGDCPALLNGVVKVDVVGVQPNTIYYVRTITEDSATTIIEPPRTEPPREVLTATETTKANIDDDDRPIVNDLILDQILEPDQVTSSVGTLMLISVPSLSDYPVSAFVGQGTGLAPSQVLIDLNNLYSKVTGASVAVPGGTRIEIIEYRGRLCPPSQQASQALRRIRRAPDHEEEPPITELERATCFAPDGVAADFDCDGAIGDGDFRDFLIQFGKSTSTAAPDCAFNPDYDLDAVKDGQVGDGDFRDFLTVFGRSE